MDCTSRLRYPAHRASSCRQRFLATPLYGLQLGLFFGIVVVLYRSLRRDAWITQSTAHETQC
eukprot:4716017-Amphidinium_carterae.1